MDLPFNPLDYADTFVFPAGDEVDVVVEKMTAAGKWMITQGRQVLTVDNVWIPLTDLQDFVADLSDAQQDRFWRQIREARTKAMNVQAGDLVEATIASNKPRTIRVRVDRAPWPGGPGNTVLSDGRGVDAVLTDSIRIVETSRRT